MKASLHKETGEKMNVYEVGYLLSPSIPEEKVAAEAGVVRALVEKHGGVVISEEFPVFIDLMYTMYKSLETSKEASDQAHFGSIKFDMPTANIAALEQALTASKNLVRFLVVKTLRENTMYSEKIAAAAAKKAEEEAAASGEAAPAPADMDKSIDALVIS